VPACIAGAGAAAAAARAHLLKRDIPLAKLRLDLMWHAGAIKQPRAPVLLYIHGGAWCVGRRGRHSRPLLAQLARSGWLVVSCSYRLAPAVPWDDMLRDVKQALWYVRCHAEKHGGDPNYIVAGGESAGGHLAALLALTPHVPEFHPPGFQLGGGEPRERAAAATALSVQGVLSIAGMLDFVDLSGALRNHGGAKELFVSFLEQFLVRGTFAHSLHQFVRASPVCWVLGARLPQALLATAPPLRLPRPEEVFPAPLVAGTPPALGRREAEEGDDFARSWAPILAVCGLRALLGPPRAPPHDHLLLASGATAGAAGGASGGGGSGGGGSGGGGGAQPAAADAGRSDPFDYVRDMLAEGAPIPPFLLVHGDADTMVPCEVTEHFWRVLQARRARGGSAGAHGARDLLLKVPGAHHASNFLFSSRTLALGDAITDGLWYMYFRRGKAADKK
jgi:acetyl esterase/lipase